MVSINLNHDKLNLTRLNISLTLKVCQTIQYDKVKLSSEIKDNYFSV